MAESIHENEKCGYIDTSDGRLFYKAYGYGMPVILLHGNGGDMSAMQGCGDILMRRGCRVILMDSRAHGRSLLHREALHRKTSASDMARDVAELMKALSISKAVLVGFSDGANTALEFAADYPEMSCGAAAVSPNAEPDGLILPVRIAAEIGKDISERRLKKLKPDTEEWNRLRQKNLQLELLTDSPHLTEDKLGRIKCPVLILSGSLDIIKHRHTEWIGRHIRDARTVFIKGASHLGFIYRRKKYMPYIASFVERMRRNCCVCCC